MKNALRIALRKRRFIRMQRITIAARQSRHGIQRT